MWRRTSRPLLRMIAGCCSAVYFVVDQRRNRRVATTRGRVRQCQSRRCACDDLDVIQPPERQTQPVVGFRSVAGLQHALKRAPGALRVAGIEGGIAAGKKICTVAHSGRTAQPSAFSAGHWAIRIVTLALIPETNLVRAACRQLTELLCCSAGTLLKMYCCISLSVSS